MIRSNYPRVEGVFPCDVPSEQLALLTRQCWIFAILFAVFDAALEVCVRAFYISLQSALDSENIVGLLLTLIVTLGYCVAAALLSRAIFVWTRLAWRTTVMLRALSPRIGETTSAWLCVIPVINFVGLMYILEWLLIRSRSAVDPTFNWKSYKSVDPLGTAFVYALGLHFGTVVWSMLQTFKSFGPAALLAIDILGSVSLVGTVYLGHRVAKQVNQNLADSQNKSAHPIGV